MTNIGKDNVSNREVWLKKKLEHLTTRSKILDAGAGEQKYKKYCHHLNYTAQDFAQYDGVGDNTGLQTGAWDQSKLDLVSDIVNIPVKNNSFDAVMCIEVLEHLPEPIKAIAEFARILKVGGKLILSAPFASLTHFAPYHFYSGYNIYFYKNFLTEYGFEIKEISYNGNYFSYLAQMIRGLNHVVPEYCGKKISLLKKAVLYLTLLILNGFNKNKNSSHELISYGLQIYAEKIK